MDIFSVFLLLGGLGLFIYGMKLMSDGLEAAAGNKLRRWLELFTKNRFAGVAVGTGVTIVTQSSSATTVMVIGFVNAGLITLKQAVSILMGANIGTTVTAQIIAFKLSSITPIFLFLGVIMMMFLKDKSVQKIGQIIAGFGILFMGMTLMSEATAPLKDWEPFVNLLATFSNPLIGILAGALFTAVIQASGATMAILLALASTGVITLDNSMYVILGLNIGTCITAILASLGANKTSKRTAVVHVLFNVFGTIIFLILMAVLPIRDWIYKLSPDSVERQLANFHMFFNIVTTLVLIWFPQLLIKISYLVVRGEDKKTAEKKLQYLISATKENPTVAVGLAVKEVARMGDIATRNFRMASEAFMEKNKEKSGMIAEQEGLVNYLNHAITEFLVEISQEELSKADSNVVASLLHLVCDIERISDHAENVAEFANAYIDNKLELSAVGRQEIQHMIDRVDLAMRDAVDALRFGDLDKAREVIEIEKEVDILEIQLKNNHVERLANGECSARGSMIYTDLITNLERVADHSTNIAYRVLNDGLYRS